ncbi:MAG: diguanylate cyclase domain-containing protein [Acidiferrobacterales bacterium]
MSVSEFVSADPTLAQTIRRHLEGLRRSGTGAGLARLLEHGLDQGGAATGLHGNRTAVSRLHAQLGAFASDGDNPPALRIKARVIQQHLVPYLEASPAAPVLHNPFQPYIDVINGIGTAPPPTPAEPLASNLHTLPQIPIGATAGARELPMSRPGTDASAPTSDAGPTDLSEWIEKALDDRGTGAAGERRYEALRRSELDAWRAIYGVMKDFKSLKQLWVSSLDELRRERVDLEQQLIGATDRIKSVESDCERLRAELDQTRRRSAMAPRQLGAVRPGARRAKRTMALPRRETFLQRLASEIERVRRHSGSLAVAMIGLEGLDALPASYGEDAGHAVLRCYVEEILSGFRTYDFVAVYDRHRFAVLFPGTERDGAVRALAKAQKRAAETHLTVGGESLPLPSFFSAVGMLAAGEDATTLMARVANAAEEARSVPPPQVLVASARPERTGPGTSA